MLSALPQIASLGRFVEVCDLAEGEAVRGSSGETV